MGRMPLNATNKLAYVSDLAADPNYATDIGGQGESTGVNHPMMLSPAEKEQMDANAKASAETARREAEYRLKGMQAEYGTVAGTARYYADKGDTWSESEQAATWVGGTLKFAAFSACPITEGLGLLSDGIGLTGLVNNLSKQAFDATTFADEIVSLNKATEGGGTIINGDAGSVVNTALYYSTPAEQGASIFRSLIMNHTFIDGNKRTAVAAFQVFAAQNGLTTVSEAELMNIANRVATGELTDVSEIATLIVK